MPIKDEVHPDSTIFSTEASSSTSCQAFLTYSASQFSVVREKDIPQDAPGKDAGAGPLKSEGDGTYNPYEHRDLENPISYWMALQHLLKGCLGAGILGMGAAIKNSGWLFGAVITPITAAVLTYAVHLLLRSARALYVRLQVPALDYAGVATQAYATGPPRVQKYQKTAGLLVDVMMSLNLLGTCCSYITFIAKSIKQMVEQYHPDMVLDIRVYIAIIFPIMALLVIVRTLRYLTVFSSAANILLGIAVGITLSYICRGWKPMSELRQISTFNEIPLYFGVVIFALEGIGMVMPLENNMKDGRQFYKTFGVFNVGMTIVTVVYMLVGISAYMKYGEEIQGSVTLNLPTNELLAQSIKSLTAIAILITYFIQFYVPFAIIRKSLLERFKDKLTKGLEYLFRLCVVTGTVLVAIAVPQLVPIVGLIGSICLSCLGIIFPAAIDLATFYEERQKDKKKKYIHTTIAVVLIILGFSVLILGTYCSVKVIIDEYH